MFLNLDVYKLEHYLMYPKGTKQIFINFTPRKSSNNAKKFWWYGGKIALKLLNEQFKKDFFDQPWQEIANGYSKLIQRILHHNYNLDHLYNLWKEQKLPIEVFALEEKKQFLYKTPCLIIWNTKPQFYWVPNFIETALNNLLWPIFNSYNTAKQYVLNYQTIYGNLEEKELMFQCHDFALRGLMGQEAGMLSGLGHLGVFRGSDNIPAIAKYLELGFDPFPHLPFSITATEHSVMCSWGQKQEKKLYETLILQNPQTIAIVSDTWNLWNICGFLDELNQASQIIQTRVNPIVLRPDSGDHIQILDQFWNQLHAKFQGNTKEGYLTLKNIRIILGEGIDPKIHLRILTKMKSKNIHWNQIYFGLGSKTYQNTSRDVHGIAIKATLLINQQNQYEFLQKNPITGSGFKKNLKGLPKKISPLEGKGTLETLAPEYKKIF